MRRPAILLTAALTMATAPAQAQTEPAPPDSPSPPIVEPKGVPTPPPNEVDPAEPAVEAPAEEAPLDITVRGLSWDVLAGGVPSSGGLLHFDLGFSALPRATYHYTLLPGFSLGGLVALDYARWAPDTAFTSSLVVAGALRYSLFRSETWSIGLRGDPGVRIGFDDPFLFGILLNVQMHVGYSVEPRVIVGGGIDVPMEIGIPDQGSAFFSAPLLVGGFVEWHVTPVLALTADLKFGPHLNTTGTIFGMRVLAGMAVRL